MNWFKNMGINKKLGVAFSTLLLFMAVIGGIGSMQLGNVNDVTHEMENDWLASALNLGDLIGQASQFRILELQHLVSSSDSQMSEYERGMAETAASVEKLLKNCAALTSTEGEKAELKKLVDLWQKYQAIHDKVLAASKANQEAQAKELVVEAEAIFRDLNKAAAANIALNKKGAGVAAERGSAIYSHAQTEIAAVLIVALILGGAMALFIGRMIGAPARHLTSQAELIAAGDLTVQVQQDSRDEIGQLAGAFATMVEKLHRMVGQISSSSAQIAAASDQLQKTAEQIAAGSEEVAAQAGTVATAGEEMSATSGDIARNCQLAAEGSVLASKAASDGAAVVANTVGVMQQIAEKVQESAMTVGSLGERSDQIGAIIGTIEDIADQTNLLALNAAIDAARAGEQGRGFAVVADEVRALAERTTRATKEIGDMIKAIQKETKGAVAAMEQGVHQVETGTEEAAKSGQALQDILQQVNEVTAQVNQIATAAEEQTATTSEISSNMVQITAVVQSTSRGAQESATAAAQLRSNAAELQQLVRQFQL